MKDKRRCLQQKKWVLLKGRERLKEKQESYLYLFFYRKFFGVKVPLAP